MKQRFITAMFLIAAVVGLLLLGQMGVGILVSFVIIVGTSELIKLFNIKWPTVFNLSCYLFCFAISAACYFDLHYFLAVSVLYLIHLAAWLIFCENISLDGVSLLYMFTIIIGLTACCVFTISEKTVWLLVWVILATAMTDTCAYFAGRFLGKKKLNPRISPNKTIAGSVGGYLGGLASALLFGYFMFVTKGILPLHYVIIYSLTVPIVAQIGDLFFSAIKRHYGVKDFGTLFPGHGGVLDRIDSISFDCIWMLALWVTLL